MSKPLELLRTVNYLAKVHYSNEYNSHVDFLSACHNALAKYFKEYFKDEQNDGFIFSALSFSNNDTLHHIDENVNEDKDRSYLFNEESVRNWIELKKELRVYKNQALNEELISITKILLDKNSTKLYKDLFFVTEDYPADLIDDKAIFQYQLKQFNDSKEKYWQANRSTLDLFFLEYGHNGSKDAYDKYVWNHHKLAEEYNRHNPGKKFHLHYIKPSISELDYGLLLSLATNRPLTADELAFVNLILYRVVSQKVRENIKEAAESLHNISVHVFKTSIKADIIREINFIENSTNEKELETLKNNANQLFILTGIINLLSKIHSKNDFINTGLTDEILSDENHSWSIADTVELYSKRLYKDKRYIIQLTEDSKKINISSVKIYDKCFSPALVKCFINTILENIETHGYFEDIGDYEVCYLEIGHCDNGWIFRNQAREQLQRSFNKLTGNLLLFKSLFEKTNSGSIEMSHNNIDGQIFFELKLKQF